VCEVLDAGRPALIVPRTKPRREQLIRAEALQRRGALSFLHPDLLSPQRLMAESSRLLTSPPPVADRPPMAGLATLADELAAVLPSPPTHAHGSPA
jgi:predicted glycosyltransferase